MKVWCPWDAIHCANSLGSCGMLGRMSISLRGVVLATPTKAVRRSRYACIESETASAAFAPFSFGRVLGRFLSFPVLVNFSMVFGNCVLQSDFGQGVVGRESVVRVLWFTRRSTKTAMAHGPSGLSSVLLLWYTRVAISETDQEVLQRAQAWRAMARVVWVKHVDFPTRH